MRPHDLDRFATVSDPTVHPDGVRVAFVVTRIDLDGDRYDRSIWLWDGEEVSQFTWGGADTRPRWSPDGSRLAFLRKGRGSGTKAQVTVLPAEGGEATVITDFSLGVTEFEWSPNGDAMWALATQWTDEWEGLDDDERARRPRTIEGFGYRFDNQGWIHDRRTHLHVIDPNGAEPPKRVGTDEASEAGAAWSPDGSRIAFLALLDNPRRMRPGVEVVEADLANEKQSVIAEGTGFVRLVYHPDGTLHAVGNDTPQYPELTSLWRLDGEPVDVTGHTDRSVFSFLLPPAMAIPDWTEEGFLIGQVDSGRVRLVRFTGEAVERVLDGDRYVTGFGRLADGSIVFSATHATDPGELHVQRPDGSESAITAFNEDFRASVPLIEPAHYRVETAPGTEIDTWLFVPEGEGPFPVLLNIHGGPASQYGFGFFDEFQVYAGAGYAVLACNPRGSTGRGRQFVQAVTGDGWGAVDLEDITAVVDDALEREPRLDGTRLGIMGGSYGGFLTAWTTARDHRYRSAVVERALLGWESFSGTSDIARDFSTRYLGLVPPDDHVGMRAASPLDRAGDITTPTLIVHSENDHRCPIEQAEQLFMTLLRNDVPVRFIRFPGEGHELSRSGDPRHRLERFEAILDWHALHLS